MMPGFDEIFILVLLSKYVMPSGMKYGHDKYDFDEIKLAKKKEFLTRRVVCLNY
jgi:hypothetical protein